MKIKIKKTLVILTVVLLGVSLSACRNESHDNTGGLVKHQAQTENTTKTSNKEQYSSRSSAKFVYYTMPSVLEACDHLDESTNGIRGIAVDPETRCEYYFGGIHANSYYSTANFILTPRYESNSKIVKYNGDLSALHHFRFKWK